MVHMDEAREKAMGTTRGSRDGALDGLAVAQWMTQCFSYFESLNGRVFLEPVYLKSGAPP